MSDAYRCPRCGADLSDITQVHLAGANAAIVDARENLPEPPRGGVCVCFTCTTPLIYLGGQRFGVLPEERIRIMTKEQREHLAELQLMVVAARNGAPEA